ncbi:MAG: coniferyl aldehyde dehydrogenase [Burkholderiales bacterium]|nr:coniferyl aldehyde dehydrogenase [Burkholderiales bacterium]
MNLNTPPVEISPATLKEQLDRLRGMTGSLLDHAARKDRLDRLEALLRANADTLSEAISRDFGHRSRHETQLLELFPSLEGIKHTRSHLKTWMRPQRGFASLWFMPARIELRPQPLGVVGIIVPWNYPLLLAVAPLASALAAGNRVMVKMSEFTPSTGELFARLIATAFPEGDVVVINGGPETGRAFAALPFDHLLFTGSTAVGREVMKSAAANLVPVTLELGGKSPAIVADDFPLDLAAERILFGKCLNAGQTCIAPDYVLLPRGKEEAFIEAARQYVATRYPDLGADYSAIVNPRHRARLRDWLAEARAAGANIRKLSDATADETKLAPVVVQNAPAGSRLMQDEIFGPILPVIGYSTLDEAIRHVNDRPRPLALYVFSHDDDTVEKVLSSTISGGVSVNETLMHISQESLPFGGVGPSGMGHYHGKFGFDTFSKLKPVFRQSRFNGLKLFHPPYGKRFETLVRLLSR